MRYHPNSHVPEPPYWLHPEVVCGLLIVLVLVVVDGCRSTVRGAEPSDYLGIKNSTCRDLTVTFDGRSILIPHDQQAAWRLPGPLPIRGDVATVSITATDSSGRSWTWSDCRVSFLVRDGRRYSLVRLIGPLEDAP